MVRDYAESEATESFLLVHTCTIFPNTVRDYAESEATESFLLITPVTSLRFLLIYFPPLHMIKEGDIAPAWKGLDQESKPVTSAAYDGKWLLLYFYPMDDTPGCTIEACGFRDSYASLSTRIAIVGVSADDSASHRKFADKFQLPFTLLADTSKEAITAYGANGLLFPKRVTFLIDPHNIVRKIYHGFDATHHAADVARDLDALKV